MGNFWHNIEYDSYCMNYTASGGGDCDDRDARDEV